jgi:uncharacterized membrane-anchored protein
MKTRIFTFLFTVAIVAQLGVPASMIFSSEKTLVSGKAFKFRTAPVDPYDAFRGKYVALDFVTSRIDSALYSARGDDNLPLSRGQRVYVIINEDSSGFAEVTGVQRLPPGQCCYVKAKVGYAYGGTTTVEFPFSKFFLEEGKAEKAEELYRKQNRTGKQDSYVIVRVGKKGTTVIEDLVLGGIPVKKALR